MIKLISTKKEIWNDVHNSVMKSNRSSISLYVNLIVRNPFLHSILVPMPPLEAQCECVCDLIHYSAKYLSRE